MYTVLMTLAFAGAADQPDALFRHRGNGCAGAQAGAGCNGSQAVALVQVQAAGCQGAQAGGCSGSFGGIFKRHRDRVEARRDSRHIRSVHTVAVAASVQSAPPTVTCPPASTPTVVPAPTAAKPAVQGQRVVGYQVVCHTVAGRQVCERVPIYEIVQP